jgi:transposase
MSNRLLSNIYLADKAARSKPKPAAVRGGFCCGCFDKQRELDKLKEENTRLKAELGRRDNSDSSKFKGSTHRPSSREDLKANSAEDDKNKKGGAKKGHKGSTRKAADASSADEHRTIELPPSCPDCGGHVENKGWDERRILDCVAQKVQEVYLEIARGYCSCCQKTVRAAVSCLPKSMIGNQLQAEAIVQHYFDGVTAGKVSQLMNGKISSGTLIGSFHRIGNLFEPASLGLIKDYRKTKVRHADETSWRTDGQSGYAWSFCSQYTTIFDFTNTRSSKIPAKILGIKRLNGFLIVDRYAGYNQVKCKLQYCFAHLLREVQELEKQFSDDEEVIEFVKVFAPLLAEAMRLAGLKLTDAEYYKRAKALKKQILEAANSPANHLAVRHIQDIFRLKKARLFHWVNDRDVPCHNNFAERTVRGVVVARKISYGSQSERGAKTRSILMTVLYTAHSRLKSRDKLVEWLKETLDKLAAGYPPEKVYYLMPPLPPSG